MKLLYQNNVLLVFISRDACMQVKFNNCYIELLLIKAVSFIGDSDALVFDVVRPLFLHDSSDGFRFSVRRCRRLYNRHRGFISALLEEAGSQIFIHRSCLCY